jgi:hypothetical protein
MTTINNPTYDERPSCRVTLGEDVSDTSILIAIKNSDAEAYKAADSAGYRVIGVNEEAGDEGDVVVVNQHIVLVKNSATNALTQADIGGLCYVEDEETVCAYAGSTNKLVAGKVVDVVTDGVYVDTASQAVPSVSAPVT